MYRVIPSITTHSESWREKITEIKDLKLKHVALFLTGLKARERMQCYELLQKLKEHHSFSIPFVHATSCMKEEEYVLLQQSFDTETFNLHPERYFPLHYELSDAVRKHIYIENPGTNQTLRSEDMNGFAGICFDLSHLHDTKRRSEEEYRELLSLLSEYRVGANHISAVGSFLCPKENKIKVKSKHLHTDKGDLNYLKELHPGSFSMLMAIELDNSLLEQLFLIPAINTAISAACFNHMDIAA